MRTPIKRGNVGKPRGTTVGQRFLSEEERKTIQSGAGRYEGLINGERIEIDLARDEAHARRAIREKYNIAHGLGHFEKQEVTDFKALPPKTA